MHTFREKRFGTLLPFLLAALNSTAAPLAAFAAPVVPKGDTVVLERLRAGGDPTARELRRMAADLAQHPNDLTRALALARRYVEVGRSVGDPRYVGRAEAVLNPWTDQPAPPIDVLIMLATFRQYRHDFPGALEILDQVLRAEPGNAQALVTRATVLQVRGAFAAAARDCDALWRETRTLAAEVCRNAVASLSGRAQASYAALQTALQANADTSSADVRLWAETTLGEMAMRLGDEAGAQRHFVRGLLIDPRDVYLRAAYADLLLQDGRPGQVVSLISDDNPPDPLLLRLLMAAREMGSENAPALTDLMKQRFDELNRRGDQRHLREEARFRLAIDPSPAYALALAEENWKLQREPWDARLVLAAASAARQPKAATPILDWMRQTGIEDVALTRLANDLREPAP